MVEHASKQRCEVCEAASRLLSRVQAEQQLQALASQLEDPNLGARALTLDDVAANERYARHMIALSRASLSAGRISKPEYVYYVRSWIEGVVHESRWVSGVYEDTLGPISDRMRAMKEAYRLQAGELWQQDQIPAEYRELVFEYDLAMDRLATSAYLEFGEIELGELRQANPAEFKVLLESGRRAALGRVCPIEELSDLTQIYLAESQQAFDVKAYYSACASLGAALEAALLTCCYRFPGQTREAVERLPSNYKPRAARDPDRWTLENLIWVAAAAGWLPIFTINDQEVHVVEQIDLVRGLRNLLHPGRHLRERPGVRIGNSDYLDAHAVYVLAKAAFEDLLRDATETTR